MLVDLDAESVGKFTVQYSDELVSTHTHQYLLTGCYRSYLFQIRSLILMFNMISEASFSSFPGSPSESGKAGQ